MNSLLHTIQYSLHSLFFQIKPIISDHWSVYVQYIFYFALDYYLDHLSDGFNIIDCRFQENKNIVHLQNFVPKPTGINQLSNPTSFRSNA